MCPRFYVPREVDYMVKVRRSNRSFVHASSWQYDLSQFVTSFLVPICRSQSDEQAKKDQEVELPDPLGDDSASNDNCTYRHDGMVIKRFSYNELRGFVTDKVERK